jgi:uncharacterized damage-inducible protein DinB
MPIADSLLPEFDHEMKTTRALLERVPDDKAAWKPHAKSMSMGELAIHVASLTNFALMTVGQTEFDMNPPGGEPFRSPKWQSSSATLATFDNGIADARRAIAGVSDAELMVPWTLKSGAHTIFTLPRIAVLRSFLMNHIIHHRGQLSVYLRLNDVPLPPMYGPTADER